MLLENNYNIENFLWSDSEKLISELIDLLKDEGYTFEAKVIAKLNKKNRIKVYLLDESLLFRLIKRLLIIFKVYSLPPYVAFYNFETKTIHLILNILYFEKGIKSFSQLQQYKKHLHDFIKFFWHELVHYLFDNKYHAFVNLFYPYWLRFYSVFADVIDNNRIVLRDKIDIRQLLILERKAKNQILKKATISKEIIMAYLHCYFDPAKLTTIDKTEFQKLGNAYNLYEYIRQSTWIINSENEHLLELQFALHITYKLAFNLRHLEPTFHGQEIYAPDEVIAMLTVSDKYSEIIRKLETVM